MSDVRLVPMTREQRDWFNFNDAFGPPVSEIVAGWDAAPDDAVGAAIKAVRDADRYNTARAYKTDPLDVRAAVAAALGLATPA